VTGDRALDDVGEADPALIAALAGGDVGTIRQALLIARVLVPMVATGNDSESAGIAVPRLVGADGRHALPVFSSYDALRSWRADARPAPMSGEQAIVGALVEGYDAVLLDPAGPVTHLIEITEPTPDAASL
jgi:hypothetical protein